MGEEAPVAVRELREPHDAVDGRQERLVTLDVSREAQQTWPRSKGGTKIACPVCGLTGYIGGKWTSKHAEHVECSCGAMISKQGLNAHRGSKARWGNPCP